MTTIARAAAAARCNASLEVWEAVHDLHLRQVRVQVTGTHGQSTGHIVGISDDGFTLDDQFMYPWGAIEHVTPERMGSPADDGASS